ncbi:MAG: hypothetical protein KGQ26_01375 [Rhodospirillales bacterium]|nr:hypothetical protein [Rhodospirillales bacterium]MDE2319864.1 hypothetical protein [Rhodospirillales bacterium]
MTDFKPFATLRRFTVLALAAAGLGGCVYYPSGYGYGRGGGYYAPAVTVAPPPIVFGGWWGDDDD